MKIKTNEDIDEFHKEFQRRMNEITSKEYDVPESYSELVKTIRSMYVAFNEDIYQSLRDKIKELELGD